MNYTARKFNGVTVPELKWIVYYNKNCYNSDDILNNHVLYKWCRDNLLHDSWGYLGLGEYTFSNSEDVITFKLRFSIA